MITELTPAQSEQLKYYMEKYIEIGQSTEPIDESVIPDFIVWVNRMLKDEAQPTDFVICDNPQACWNEVKKDYSIVGPEPFEPAGFQGNVDVEIAAKGAFYEKVLGVNLEEVDFKSFLRFTQALHYVWSTSKRHIFCQRPVVCDADEDGNLLALEYRGQKIK